MKQPDLSKMTLMYDGDWKFEGTYKSTERKTYIFLFAAQETL